jgi:hypothetical protein
LLEQLKNNNFRLQEENESIRILKNKINELELEETRSMQQINFFERQVSQLKSDNEMLNKKLNQSEQNLANIINRSKGQFLVQNVNGQSEYVAKKEWELINALKSAQTEMINLQEEKDKYYLKYFELLGVRGELQKENLDDSLMDMANMKYQNNLQMAETREKQLRKKLRKQKR